MGTRERGQSISVLPTQQLQQCPSGHATVDLPFKPIPNPGVIQECYFLGELGQEWVIY